MTDWWIQVKAVSVLDAVDALRMLPTRGKGRAAVWSLPHVGCDGHGSGKAPVHYASEADRLRCRVCGCTWDTMGLLEVHLGIELPAGGSWVGSAEVDQLRAEAAALGWCLPDEKVDPDQRAIWAMQRQAQLDAQRADVEARRARERAQGLDVGLGWSQLQRAQAGRDEVRRWAIEQRRMPAGLAQYLPMLDLAAVPDARVDVPSAGGELLAIAQRRGLHILLAQRDGAGAVQSIRTRWHEVGARPTAQDGKARPKAMALPADRIQAGPVDRWAGQVCTFGSLEVAVDMALQGAPVVLVEGGPDYCVTAAMCSAARYGVAVGFPGDTAIVRVARYLRAEMRARIGGTPGPRPHVILVPHTEPRAQASAEDARRELRWTADVSVATLPEGQDINDIAAAHGAQAVAELLSSARGGHNG